MGPVRAHGPVPARSGVVVLHSGRSPVAERHFRLLELRRGGAVVGAGPFIGRARFATRSDSARRTAVVVGIRGAAAAAVDDVVAPVRTAAGASATDAVRASAAAVRASAVAVRAFAVVERPECPPPGSAIATVTLGPPIRRHAATTPIPAARRRFAWATVPLLRVAKTCRRVRIGFLHADAPSSHPFEESMQINVSSAIHPRRTSAIGR